MPNANDLRFTISWFATGKPKGPAIGEPECTTWGRFAEALSTRREGEKDGPAFIPARFKFEPDGKHVRRLGANLIARTAVTLMTASPNQLLERTRIRNGFRSRAENLGGK